MIFIVYVFKFKHIYGIICFRDLPKLRLRELGGSNLGLALTRKGLLRPLHSLAIVIKI